MLTKQEYVDAQTLRSQGWSISAIARHLGRDRKTVRSYLTGDRIVGSRRPALDEFERFLPYCRQRLNEATHLEATVLFEELVELGYQGAYSTFTRALRKHQVRPACAVCRRDVPGHAGWPGRPSVEEVRFAWLKAPGPPRFWGCDDEGLVLLGALPGTGQWRGVITDSDDFPQLAEAVDEVLRRLGGTGGVWRFHRSMPVYAHGLGKVVRTVNQLAHHYGVVVGAPLANGEGITASEEELRSAVQEWWRVVPGDCPMPEAQLRLDELAAEHDPVRYSGRAPLSLSSPAARARMDLPASPFPAQISVLRTVSPQGTVAFRGNSYAVPADLADAVVEVRWPVGDEHLSIATARGAVITRHAVAPRGARLIVNRKDHEVVLERPARVPVIRTSRCPERTYRPPSDAALDAARTLCDDATQTAPVTMFLQRYVRIAQATGVLAARHGISTEQALTLIHEHAQANGVQPHEAAAAVVEGNDTVASGRSAVADHRSPLAPPGYEPGAGSQGAERAVHDGLAQANT